MDERGELGPIDPQLVITRDQQPVASPAQAVLDQFERAQKDIKDQPERLPAWIPILRQYGPSLLEESQNAIDLAKRLVRSWLETYMFAGMNDADERANGVASWIGDHNAFKAHPRQIDIGQLLEKQVKVIDLRNDPSLRDAIWAVWSAYRVTFDDTGAFKIFENSRGESYVRNLQRTLVPIPAPPPPSGGGAQPNRVQRRQQQRGR